MIVHERRASTILYNLLLADEDRRPYLLPANVCPVVPLVFRKAGRPFELVDVSVRTLGMDPELCLDRIQSRPGAYRGVVFVHTYGASLPVAELIAAIRERSEELFFIDDRCLCAPDVMAPAVAGVDVTLYSTGYGKYVDVGGGGFARLAKGVRYARRHETYRPADEEATEEAYKQAIAERRPLDPAWGSGPWLDLRPPEHGWSRYCRIVVDARRRASEHKMRLNHVYRTVIPEEAQLATPFHTWRFQVVVPQPGELLGRLQERGLFASRHYASLGGVFAAASFPVAEAVHGCIMNLFNDFNYDERRAHATAEEIERHWFRFRDDRRWLAPALVGVTRRPSNGKIDTAAES